MSMKNKKGISEIWEILAFAIVAVIAGALLILIFLRGFNLI